MYILILGDLLVATKVHVSHEVLESYSGYGCVCQ